MKRAIVVTVAILMFACVLPMAQGQTGTPVVAKNRTPENTEQDAKLSRELESLKAKLETLELERRALQEQLAALAQAREAAMQAITSPLLETSVDGANGVLINITGGPTLTLAEVKSAADEIFSVSDQDANIIFGAVIDERMKDYVRVTVLATGFDEFRSEPSIPMRDQVHKPVIPEGADIDEDELDIPAFLRRGRFTG